MAAAHKLSNALGLPSPARSGVPADTPRRSFGTFRCVESLPAEKAQFKAERSLVSELPERLAVYLSAGLVGLYAAAFLAQFVTRYIGM